MKTVEAKNQTPATKSLRAPVGLQVLLVLLLLGCGKSDQVTSQTPATNSYVTGSASHAVPVAAPTKPPSHEAVVYADIMQSLKDAREGAVMNKKYLKLIVDQADWFHDCVRQTTQEYDRLHCDSRGDELYKRNKTLQGRP